MVSVRSDPAGEGNRKLVWPLFKPTATKDPVLGIKELTPEQTLIEFICTSASLHKVRRQSIRQLEWDILKVFNYNIMPANAAAWYMAKRKFYANQPQDNQLLPFILKKYPHKFRVYGYQVEFLEKYNIQTARHKLNYLVHYGLNAYFSHKVDEYGVYFFDPNYYEKTEPFHSSLQLCARGRRVNMLGHYFGWNEGFIFKQHSGNLASITRNKNIKVIDNAVGVVISMSKNGQYGFLKFGSGEKAIFCTKALFKDGYPYTGDPLRLPAIYFDAYQIPGGVKVGEGYCSWFAAAVWVGKKPAAKFYCNLSDFRLTSAMLMQGDGNSRHGQQGGARQLRAPSSSMMIGQVVEIRKNGAVVSVRDDSKEKVFIPGWSRQTLAKSGTWLTTLTGDSIGMRDLIAYYLDTNLTVPGFTAVGKNVMVLKEHEEVESTRRRRQSHASLSMSEGARYDTDTGATTNTDDNTDVFDSSDESEGEEVSEGELEWLQKDVENLIASEESSGMLTFLVKTHDELAEARQAMGAAKKSPSSGRERKDSGLGSKPTTPVHMNTIQVSSRPSSPMKEAFSRTKAALASIDEDYRSSDDDDYETGDEISSLDVAASRSRSKKKRAVSTSDSSGHESGRDDYDSKSKVVEIVQKPMPFWVRAISMPEEYDTETGLFLPVDKMYRENRDLDYELPFGVEHVTHEQEGKQTFTYEEFSDTESIDEEEDLDEELKLLLEESKKELAQDLKDKKHHPRTKETEDNVAAASDEAEKIKVVDETKTEDEPKDSEFELRKFWYEPSYIRFIQTLQADEGDEEHFDSDYYPSSTIVDENLDYDEYDPEDVITKEELQGLQEDMKLDLTSFGSYLPVWVHVDSVKVRKEAAKVIAEEKQKAAEEKQKAAKERQRIAEEKQKEAAAKASEEAANKGEKEEDKAQKPLDLKALDEAAAKLDAAEAKPQRKLSAKSSPRKSPKKGSSPKSESPKKTEGGSPKKAASPGCTNT